MTIPIPPFLRNIDGWLLVHKPEVWLTQIHLITLYGLISVPAFGLLALIPPIMGYHWALAPVGLAVLGSFTWLQLLLQMRSQLPFKPAQFPYTLLFIWSIIFLNTGPATFLALYAPRQHFIAKVASDPAFWSTLLLLSAMVGSYAASTMLGPYPLLAAMFPVTLQFCMYPAMEARTFIDHITTLSEFLIGLYICSLVALQVPGLPRWVEFGMLSMMLVTTPVVPLSIGCIYLRTIGQRASDGTVLLAIGIGMVFSIAFAPVWERRLGELRARPE